MANLSTRVEKFKASHLARDIAALRREVALLRSARGTIGRGEFPAGVIPPAALEQATAQPGLVNLTQTGFALTTSSADLITATITVPAGFTGCVVNLLGRVYATNSTGATGFLSAQTRIGSVAGNALPVRVAAAAAGVNPAPLATLLTGMAPGSAFTVALLAWTDVAWASSPSNLADLTGLIVWVP